MMSLPVHKHTNTCHSEKISRSVCKQASATKTCENGQCSKIIGLLLVTTSSRGSGGTEGTVKILSLGFISKQVKLCEIFQISALQEF